MKFKVGDRVAVYCYSRLFDGRETGKIKEIDQSDNTIFVEECDDFEGGWFQQEQCRKLVKKKKEWPISFPTAAELNKTREDMLELLCIHGRISDLEMICKGKEIPHHDMLIDAMHDFEKRIVALEKHLPAEINKNIQIKLEPEKKPHKCIVCNGQGYTRRSMCTRLECVSCEGKGIVWG